MNVQTIRAADLTPEQIELWGQFQELRNDTDSPFLGPGFTQAVAELRDDVEVAIMRHEGRTVGFLPFHRNSSNVGRPVGLRLSDLQGAVTDQGIGWDAGQIVRECGLAAWHFDHLLSSQPAFEPYRWGEAMSPCIDLSTGFDAYKKQRRKAGSELLSQIARKSRKFEREVGPLRFEWHTTDRAVFESVLAWKSDQRQRTGTFDVLRLDWVVELLDRLRVEQSASMSGVLSALYVGDHLAAAHLGLRGRHSLHIWFPVFDRELQKYSPGLVLMLEMMKACDQHGVRLIHLGKGVQQYKLGLMTDGLPLAAGCVARRGMSWAMQSAWYKTRQWLKTSSLRGAAQIPKRILRTWQHRASMR